MRITVKVDGAADVVVETDHEHPKIAVYLDGEPVMGLLPEYGDEGAPKQHLVIGHWPDGEEWVGLVETKVESQDWIDAEVDRGIRGARSLYEAAQEAHRMVHGTREISIDEFDEHVAEERRSGAWIVFYSEHHRRGFDDEVRRIHDEMYDQKKEWSHGHG